jgi:hypothetical protein
MAGEALRDRDVERFKKLEAVRARLDRATRIAQDGTGQNEAVAEAVDAVYGLTVLIEDIVRELASGAPR